MVREATKSTPRTSRKRKTKSKSRPLGLDEYVPNSDSRTTRSFNFKVKRRRMEPDIATIKHRCFSQIEKIKDTFGIEEYAHNIEFLTNLESLNETYLDIYGKPPAEAKPVLEEVSNFLMEHEVDNIMLTIMVESLPKTCGSDENITALERKVLNESVRSFRRFADHSAPLSLKVCEKANVLEILADALQFHCVHVNNPDYEKVNFLSLLCLVYICSLHSANWTRLRDVGLARTLNRIVGCDDNLTAFTATLALVGILDEEQSKCLQSQTRTIEYLINLLDEGIDSPYKRSYGWTTKELVTACSRLTRNDVNKEILVNLGILKHLVGLSENGTNDEKEEVLGALWALAFLEINKEKMVREKKLIENLLQLRESTDDRLKEQSINTLWTLKEGLLSSPNPEFKKLGKELSASVKQNSEHSKRTSDKHIMISYNWGSEKVVSKLRERLQEAGYLVWLDKERMTGSLIECIANGLENAYLVLMCISRKYKNSKYCRNEAEYAFDIGIPIVPLLMEPNYKGDGWVGFIRCANLYFDFSEEDAFDHTFDAFVKEIKKKTKCLTGTKAIDETDSKTLMDHGGISGHGTGMGNKVVLTNWSSDDVRTWLHKNGCYSSWVPYFRYFPPWIQSLLARESLEKLTGAELIFLKKLQEQAPEFFYSYLKTELNLNTITSLAKFVCALELS